jgi:ketosteroid isomerase-like protein
MSAQEGGSQSRATFERLQRIITTGDLDSLPEVLHPDFVQEMPQSHERVVGIANFRKILENLPGGGSTLTLATDPHIAGHGEHWVMTPTFNVVRVEGTDDELTSYVKARYPDGSDWYIVTFSSFKDGKIIKRIDFYAPCYESPAWRAEWVEKL